jgi:hypothetical protein
MGVAKVPVCNLPLLYTTCPSVVPIIPLPGLALLGFPSGNGSIPIPYKTEKALLPEPVFHPTRVSGRSETKTYGKSTAVREREESKTLPRKSFFGKDHDKRSRVLNVLQVLFFSNEGLFSGKLPSTALVGRQRASP